MQSDIPKTYLDLLGRPVLYYSLRAFEDSEVDDVILVVAENMMQYCKKEIVEKYGFKKVRQIVAGGKERYDSVFCGLKAIDTTDYVLIHDGARAMLDPKIIHKCMEEVAQCDACVVGMPVKDTIKVIDVNGYASHTPDRKMLWQVQTPQCFAMELVYQAYDKVIREQVQGITDDAMVVEYATEHPVRLIEGSYRNLKITTPEDLAIAATLLQEKA